MKLSISHQYMEQRQYLYTTKRSPVHCSRRLCILFKQCCLNPRSIFTLLTSPIHDHLHSNIIGLQQRTKLPTNFFNLISTLLEWLSFRSLKFEYFILYQMQRGSLSSYQGLVCMQLLILTQIQMSLYFQAMHTKP